MSDFCSWKRIDKHRHNFISLLKNNMTIPFWDHQKLPSRILLNLIHVVYTLRENSTLPKPPKNKKQKISNKDATLLEPKRENWQICFVRCFVKNSSTRFEEYIISMILNGIVTLHLLVLRESICFHRHCKIPFDWIPTRLGNWFLRCSK